MADPSQSPQGKPRVHPKPPTNLTGGAEATAIAAAAMADGPEVVPRFSVVQSEPWGPNPYSKGDPAHDVFDRVSELTQLELSAFAAAMFARMPAEDAKPDEWQTWRLEVVAGQFAVKVTALLSAFGASRESLTACERAIDHLADDTLKAVNAHPKTGNDPVFISRLKTKMLEYREYSLGQASRVLREAVTSLTGSTPGPEATPGPNNIAEAITSEPRACATSDGSTNDPSGDSRHVQRSATADHSASSKSRLRDALRRVDESLPSDVEAIGVTEALLKNVTDAFDAGCQHFLTMATGRFMAEMVSTVALPLWLEDALNSFEALKFQASQRYGLGSVPELSVKARERLGPRMEHWRAAAFLLGQLAEAEKAAAPGPEAGPGSAPESPVANEMGGTDAKPTGGISSRRRRGPEPDHDKTALPVADTVKRIAPEGNWKDKDKLEEIRHALDGAEIPTPGTWRGLSWTEQVDPLVKKAIARRLEIAKKARQQTPA